jgi:DNA-binding transcriptional LysR family regulator
MADSDLLETAELAAFVCAVDAGSVSRAAKELAVPRATLGRRLERLERRVGARLVRRTTRSFVPTEEGRILYARAKAALAAVRDAADSVGRHTGAIRGRVRISTPPLGGWILSDVITEFLAAHPDVTLEVSASTAWVSFEDDGYDLAVRATTRLDPGLVRRPIGEARLVAVASPTYLAARGTPRRAAELTKHACILGYARGEVPTRDWPTPSGTIRVDGPLATNELGLARDAACAGLGIALLPETVVASSIAAGELVELLRGEVGTMSTIAVVYPERKLLRPAVRAFVEALAVRGRAELSAHAGACDTAARRELPARARSSAAIATR